MALFADDNCLCRKLQTSTKKLLEIMRSYSKVSGRKANIQKPIAFIYTSNKQANFFNGFYRLYSMVHEWGAIPSSKLKGAWMSCAKCKTFKGRQGGMRGLIIKSGLYVTRSPSIRDARGLSVRLSV